MKYIRTKDGIKKVFRKLKDGFYLVKVSKYKYYHYYPDCKTADTIKELCDTFVGIGEKGIVCAFSDVEELKKYDYTLPMQKIIEKYGAIHIKNKGLIYVAKMNNEGELELL